MKVFDSSGRPTPTSVLAGLNAVYANRSAFGGVRVVNMSLGGGGPFQSDCDDQFPADAAAVDQLVAAGIAVVIASGNDGFRNGISEPACLSHAVAVGAVYDAAVGPETFGLPSRCSDPSTAADQITCYSNSGHRSTCSHRRTARRPPSSAAGQKSATEAPRQRRARRRAAAQILSLRPRTLPAELRSALWQRKTVDRRSEHLARSYRRPAAYQSLVAADHLPCVRDANTACLQDGRFEVKVTYASDSGAGDASVMAFGVRERRTKSRPSSISPRRPI